MEGATFSLPYRLGLALFRKSRGATSQPSATLVDRQDGKLYSALWERALADKPDWVLINSFNQWHTGTEIEPSAELGALYLNLTRQYAARFKSAK